MPKIKQLNEAASYFEYTFAIRCSQLGVVFPFEITELLSALVAVSNMKNRKIDQFLYNAEFSLQVARRFK